MSDHTRYDEDYFLRGRETGKSLYENYRWMPDLTIPMVQAIAQHLNIGYAHNILDFGCARGYVVRVFRELGYNAYGVDVSEWAIRNADESVKPYLNWCENSPPLLDGEYDWIIAKDVLEHIEYVDLAINDLMRVASKGVFAVVPLSDFDGVPYTVPEYEMDVTHIQRKSLISWAKLFIRTGWSVEVRYRLPGVKDNYAHHPKGNGFITARRVYG